jgi:hypothetical protein
MVPLKPVLITAALRHANDGLAGGGHDIGIICASTQFGCRGSLEGLTETVPYVPSSAYSTSIR